MEIIRARTALKAAALRAVLTGDEYVDPGPYTAADAEHAEDRLALAARHRRRPGRRQARRVVAAMATAAPAAKT